MRPKTILFALMSLMLLTNCGGETKKTLQDNAASNVQTIVTSEKSENTDTTIYQNPFYAPKLPDAENYFRNNNKYKDWDKANKKNVRLYGILEKDGTFVVEDIKGDSTKELVEEAIRLAKEAIIVPAKNENNEVVRSYFFIGVDFPPK